MPGESTRDHGRSLGWADESIGGCGATKNRASHALIGRIAEKLVEFMSRKLCEAEFDVCFIDVIEQAVPSVIVPRGARYDRTRLPLGILAGSSGNRLVATALMSNPAARGPGARNSERFVVHGGKNLRMGLPDVFGQRATVQRCQVQQAYNVPEPLPEARLVYVARPVGDARATTNAIENRNGTPRRFARNVQRRNDETTAHRSVAVGVVEAPDGFRRAKRHTQLSVSSQLCDGSGSRGQSMDWSRRKLSTPSRRAGSSTRWDNSVHMPVARSGLDRLAIGRPQRRENCKRIGTVVVESPARGCTERRRTLH